MKGIRVLMVMALLGLAAFGCPPDKECRKVDKAVEGLSDPDELTVRGAIESLSGLTDSKCIGDAVGPLAEVMVDSGRRHDIFTRSQAAPVLAKIARTRKNWKKGSEATAPLVEMMFHGQSDILRSQAAYALGDCGWAEVLPALRAAAATDRSAMVQSAAALAASRFDSTVPARSGPSVSTTAAPRAAAPFTAASAPACISAESKEFMDRHLIILSPDVARPPVCEE